MMRKTNERKLRSITKTLRAFPDWNPFNFNPFFFFFSFYVTFRFILRYSTLPYAFAVSFAKITS